MKNKLEGRRCLGSIGDRLDSLSEPGKDLICIAVLALLPVIFLGNVLFTDQVLVSPAQARDLPWRAYARQDQLSPHVHWRIDPPYYYYPQRIIAARTVENGELPLWNPYYLAGVPFLATEPWAGLFYPPNLIYYLVDPLEAFGYSMCLHLALAGLFMYFYLRSIDLDRLSSLFGGIAFELGGFFLANLMWPVRVVTATWAPLTFLCFHRYWKERRLYWAVLLAFGVGMSILAGYTTVFLYMMFALGLYYVLTSIREVRQEGIKRTIKPTMVVGAAVATGVLLSAVQVIPTLEAIPFMGRLDRPYEDRIGGGLHPINLATAIVPDIFGNRIDTDQPEWDDYGFAGSIPSNYSRASLYTGIVPLVFACCALAFRRNVYTIFFAVLALLSLSVVLDLPSVTFRILYAIPVLRIGRQVEFKAVYALAISVLAAQGFQSLVQKHGRSPMMSKASWALLTVGGGVLLGIGLGLAIDSLGGLRSEGLLHNWFWYCVPHLVRLGLIIVFCGGLLLLRSQGKMEARTCGSLLIIVAVLDLFQFGWRANTTQRAGDLYFTTPSIEFLQGDADISRIMRGPDGDQILRANSPSVYGISDAQGYAPAMFQDYARFIKLIARAPVGIRRVPELTTADALSSKLLDLLNVKYILAPPGPNAALDQLDQADADIALVYDAEIKIYENVDVLPRAFVVHNFKVLPNRGSVLAELTGEEFDPGAYVILEEDPATNATPINASVDNSTARILDYTANRVLIETDMASAGFLILSDLYYPGWKALVDGASEKVHKADYIFRAVQLTEGHHTVEFVYDPLSFKLGLGISASALGMMGLLTVCVALRGYRLRQAFVH